MTKKIIYYSVVSNDNPSLEREIKFLSKNFVFSKCPVISHKLNRTFVCNSTIDFSLNIDKENKKISLDRPDLVFFDDEHLFSASKPVVQLTFCQFLFWTNEDNIWFEFNDHPMTSYSNNFIATAGWFNLSNWPRATSLGVVLVDENKPLIIKKGDPLFRITFHSSNLNDGIILKREENVEKSQKIISIMDNNIKSQRNNKESLLRKLFFNKNSISTNKEKKCPFRFLHK
jgi:hypothetical protein